MEFEVSRSIRAAIKKVVPLILLLHLCNLFRPPFFFSSADLYPGLQECQGGLCLLLLPRLPLQGGPQLPGQALAVLLQLRVLPPKLGVGRFYTKGLSGTFSSFYWTKEYRSGR